MLYCLIPARKNSKRIKKKNIQKINGKPIITWSIINAKKSKLFKKIFVSTDCKRIARISNIAGASTPFLRPKKISNDFSIDIDVINHFLKYLKNNKIDIKYLLYLYPTSPLFNSDLIKNSYNKFKKIKCSCFMTLGEFSHPIERSLIKLKKNFFKFSQKKYINYRTQDLQKKYYDLGQCYWYRIHNYKIKKINGSNLISGIVLNSNDFIDINTKNDLLYLKKIFRN